MNMPVRARYEAFRSVQDLTNAHAALEEARGYLIAAELSLPPASPALRAIRGEIIRMKSVLYADTIEHSGGDMEAWDIRSLVLRLGAEACDGEEVAS